MTQGARTPAQLVETYRRRARHYDVTCLLCPVPGYPQGRQRLRAVESLHLRPGDRIVDVACGTGLNFPLVERMIGPVGRIVGVDLTDAMLAQAERRAEVNGWTNVSLVQRDAAAFEFPDGVDAILSTYALTQVHSCADVIRHGSAALRGGGRWSVLDVKVPDATPDWLARGGTAMVRPFAAVDDWLRRHPWEVIRLAMEEELVDLSWTELFFGTAFLATGSRGTRGTRPYAADA